MAAAPHLHRDRLRVLHHFETLHEDHTVSEYSFADFHHYSFSVSDLLLDADPEAPDRFESPA